MEHTFVNPTLDGWRDFVGVYYDPASRYEKKCPRTLLHLLYDESISAADRVYMYCKCAKVPNTAKILFAVSCVKGKVWPYNDLPQGLLSDAVLLTAISTSEKFSRSEATEAELYSAWANAINYEPGWENFNEYEDVKDAGFVALFAASKDDDWENQVQYAKTLIY